MPKEEVQKIAFEIATLGNKGLAVDDSWGEPGMPYEFFIVGWVSTPKLAESDTDPLQDHIPDRQYISLCEVLATVNHHSQFLEGFQHWQQRYNRSKPSKGTFIAAILALGCDIRTGKILKI